MKVAGNKVKHIVEFFHSQLDGIFESGEVNALLNLAFEHYLGFNKTEIVFKLNENVNQSDLLKLYDCCKLLRTGKPIQYILHEAWFCNLKFYVDENVLIPRPETEELVELVIKEKKAGLSLLDIGTGSGCIPVSIKKYLPSFDVYACDISATALQVAGKNAKTNNVEVNFFETNVLNTEQFIHAWVKKFDIVVSNPPYIKETEKGGMNKNVLDHEPHLALFVNDNDEIIFYKKIIELCKTILNKSGSLYFELNPITANEVREFALTTNLFERVELINDMSGKIRFMRAVRA